MSTLSRGNIGSDTGQLNDKDTISAPEVAFRRVLLEKSWARVIVSEALVAQL
ncbi:MAG: hypothetical protein GY822_14375 [Deltaproteobacteria bacterium]|nr:hypothetical protein [Deltaproteobacteria bacterium]